MQRPVVAHTLSTLRVQRRTTGTANVKTLIALLLWCVLLALCWPLALLALVLWPVAWLIALPFRLVGITLGALFAVGLATVAAILIGRLILRPVRALAAHSMAIAEGQRPVGLSAISSSSVFSAAMASETSLNAFSTVRR